MHSSATIRPTEPGDATALARVIDLNELFPGELLEEMQAGFFAGTAPDDRWLTLDDGEPVGVAYYAPERMTDGTWNLLLIAVRPDRQGAGHGAALMGHVEAALAGRGARVLIVETSGTAEFAGARAFYAGLGYDEEARIRDFYEAGDDKVVFWKALDQ